MKIFKILGAASLALALTLTAKAAFASEAVPLSIAQDKLDSGCAGYINSAIQPGPNLTNFGVSCSVVKGFTLTASTDYSHGFSVRAGANVGLGKIAGLTTVASLNVEVPVGGLQDLLNSTSLQPAFTMHNKNALGPIGVGAQYSATIPVSANNGFAPPDEHGGTLWLSAELVPDELNIYGIGSITFYGTPVIAACGECSSKLADFFGPSSEIRAGGGVNWYYKSLRISFEGTASVDGSPFGQNRRSLMFGVTKQL